MKAILIVSLAIVALSNAAPNTKDESGHKPSVILKLRELRQTVRSTVDDIEDIVRNDNPEVADKIENRVKEEVKKARELLRQARASGATLKEKGDEVLNKVVAHIEQIRESLKADIQILKPETQEKVKQAFDSGFAKARVIVGEIRQEIEAA